MLKRHNRLVLLMVLAAFMFSLASPGAAAAKDTFSDLNGSAPEIAAIYQLNSLGVIEGYPDGTFQPDKTITRAEFAKIAVNISGLQAVASGMSSSASVFKDVYVSDWYNGFVNVAAAQGYVKGDPSGNFRPNDEITQAEVITVLMRILGYNDNLPGDWPADYISKASNLELLEDVTFVANKAATRAEVACMASAALDEYVVEYQADSNTFKNALKVDKDDLDQDGDKSEEITYTLIEDKFKGGSTDDALVAQVNVPDDEDGQYELEYYTMVDGDWEKDTVTVAENFVVANGKSILDANMRFVDFVLNDDDEAVYVSILDYGTVKDDEIECKSFDSDGLARRIELNGKDYDFADNVIWKPSSLGNNYLQRQSGVEDSADYYIATLNDDGDVAAVTVSTQPTPGIVDYVNSGRKTISFKSNPEACLTMLGDTYSNKVADLDDSTYFVVKDGIPAALADIEEGDAVLVLTGQDDYTQGGYAGVDYYIVAQSQDDSQAEGTLEAVESNADGTLKTITVDDKEYDVVESINYNKYRSILADGSTSPVDLEDNEDDQDILSEVIHDKIEARIAELVAAGIDEDEAEEQAEEELALQPVKPVVSTDDGDDFEAIDDADYISSDPYDLLGDDVTVVLTPNGKVGAIIGDDDSTDSGKIFGSIISIVHGTTKGSELVDMIKIVNKDDKEVSYAIDDDTTYNGQEIKNIYQKLSLGDMIGFTVTGDGNIDNIKTTDIKTATIKADEIDDDLDSLKINGSWHAASGATVFNYDSSEEDSEVVSWSDLEDTVAARGSLDIQYYADDNKVNYVSIKDIELTTESNYAVYVKNGTDSDDKFAKIIYDGKEQKVYLTNEASYTELKKYSKGNLLEFKWEGSDIKVMSKSALLSKIVGGGYGEITDLSIKSNIVEISGKAYLVDEDTVVYDSTDHDNLQQLSLNELARGDEVYAVYDKDNKALAAIVITDDEDAEDMGLGPMGSSEDVAVTGVTLTPETLELTAGGAAGTLTATVAPANATNQTVTWSSSNTAIATVSGGVVTPVAAGTATITATTADGSKTDTCLVTVKASVVNAACTATFTSTATVGRYTMGKVTIALTGLDNASTFTVTYEMAGTTETTEKASINSSSSTIVKGNTVTIKVYDAAGNLLQTFSNIDLAADDTTDTAQTIPISGISLNPTSLTLLAGGAAVSITAMVQPDDATNQNLIWASSNADVATVADGVVTPLAAGTTVISAITEDGNYSAECRVTVKPAVIPVSGISIHPTELTLKAGGEGAALTADIEPADASNRGVMWASSNTSVVKVKDGFVTPTGEGTAVIKAITEDGYKVAQCTVTVRPSTIKVASIALNPDVLDLTAGGEAAVIAASVEPADASNKNIIWASSNVGVAKVKDGVVTPTGEGTAVIKAITEDGYKVAQCTVTVKPAAIKVDRITLIPAVLNLTAGGAKGNITAVIEPANASNQDITWASADPGIASVQDGIVTPLKAGTTVITATADGNKTAQCAVTVTEGQSQVKNIDKFIK